MRPAAKASALSLRAGATRVCAAAGRRFEPLPPSALVPCFSQSPVLMVRLHPSRTHSPTGHTMHAPTTAGSPHGWGVMTAARCVFMLSITYTHPHTQAAAWIRIRTPPAAERVRLVSSSPPDVSRGGAAQAQAKPHATHKTGRARPKKG